MNSSTIYCERFSGMSSRRCPQPNLDNHLPNVLPVLPVTDRAVRSEPELFQPVAEPQRSRRRLFFRCLRVVMTGMVLAGVGAYVRHTLNSATSETACINGEIRVLRAPIEGELVLEQDNLGVLIPQGAPLFKIHNSRFGNQEAAAQLNWLTELSDRLELEVAEAVVRVTQQEEIFKTHQKLYESKLISRLAFVEERTKLTLAQTILTGKEAQFRQAAARILQMERQVDLRKEAAVHMPFDGVVWTVSAQAGTAISAYEPVIQVIDRNRIWVDAFFHEKHAPKLRQGTRVRIRALDGTATWQGRVESVRSGVGRIAAGNPLVVPAGGFAPRRVAARVMMDTSNPYAASEFFGVGRSVVVSLDCDE